MTRTPRRSPQADGFRTTLIAPCGMDCRLCRAYGRDKRACPGCRGDDSTKAKTRITCPIKNCERIVPGKVRFCFHCDGFPCDRLGHLDKRYRTKYGMSMIDNLERIKKVGIRQFIRHEKEKWTCPECGGILCVHESQCLTCLNQWR
ncbi:MAG: DUF3795 domain-containing protein [Deltaproteobacteria bacterium]|nr:DUF3795 domain-containing protein [Deltaproteobacteria bacterium]